MKRIFNLLVALEIMLIGANLFAAPAANESSQPPGRLKTIAVLGSSLASGWVTNFQARHDMENGWAHRLARALALKGYQVVNISKPGDNSDAVLERMDKDLLPLKAGHVIIGLSLENEGIRGTLGMTPPAVYEKFRENMLKIVAKCRANGISPIIGLCYPCDRYQEEEYQYIKKMNLLINSWDLPSVNFLGALDNGQGHFPQGYTYDEDHPGNRGHEEMFYAVVPTLFDALQIGKTQPRKPALGGFVTLKRTSRAAPLSYIPDDVIHSFTEAFRFRSATGGILAAVSSGNGMSFIELSTDGSVQYVSSTGEAIRSRNKAADNQWHDLVLSHRHLQGETLLFVDGVLAGKVGERMEPRQYVLGGSGRRRGGKASKKADFQDWLIFRAALNPDEVQNLFKGNILQASLEVYAPLNDPDLKPGKPLPNLAQSLSEVVAYPSRTEAALTRIERRIKEAETARSGELTLAEKQPIKVDPEIFDAYSGEYEIAPGDNIRIARKNDRIYLVDRGQETELLAESATAFFIRQPLVDIVVTFFKDNMGVVTQLVFQVGDRAITAKKVK